MASITPASSSSPTTVKGLFPSNVSCNIGVFKMCQILFLRTQEKNNGGLFMRFKVVKPFLCHSSLLEPPEDKVVDEKLVQEADNTETILAHVKFQLQKECLFGQRFLIVGSDPIFGMWDAKNAIPMTWSEGHIWTVEIDIPIGKVIQFKFILESDSEEFLWQPGPDRVVETWETTETIIVAKEWDADADADSEQEARVENLIAENTIYPNGVIDVFPKETNNERDLDNLLQIEGEPILVPGLTPLPTITDKVAPTSDLEGIEPEDSYESKKFETKELLEEEKIVDMQKEEEANVLQEKPRLTEADCKIAEEILRNDIQWSHKSIQKLLMDFLKSF